MRITAITTSRADYGHLYWPLKHLHAHPEVELRLVVTGAHLSPQYGRTIDQIDADGFTDIISDRIECLVSSDTDTGMAKTIGNATLSLADALSRPDARPDCLLLIADRYEMLAPASVALALRIPIAHIEGGDISEGAIDNQVRHALTMMSHIHFAPTTDAAARIIAMGEEPWRVHVSGAPSLDHLHKSDIPAPEEVAATLGLDLNAPVVVIAHHPLTLARDTNEETDAVFAALEEIAVGPMQVVFCFPNADAGSHEIVSRARAFCAAHNHATLHINLDHLLYWGLLHCADVLVGNSSSGIMETPSVPLPCVNIGRRQQGRTRATNIIDVPPQPPNIVQGVGRALSPDFADQIRGCTNPYGTGNAAQIITDVLTGLDWSDQQRLLIKRTMPITAQRESEAVGV